MIYLDNNATVPMLLPVKQRLLGFLSDAGPINASAIHALGREAKDILERAREEVLQAVAPSGYGMVFVPSATIANNIVVKSFDRVAISAAEHPSVCVQQKVTIPVNADGYLDMDFLAKAVSGFSVPFLVSVAHASGETGVINSIAEVARLVHSMGGFVHTDAVQSFGKIVQDVSALDADYVTISSHKIGGPVGSAAIIYKKSAKLLPVFCGGGQEFGICAGTENLFAIVGFAEAVKQIDIEKYQQHTLSMQQMLESKCGDLGGIVIAKSATRLPNTTMLAMPGFSNKSQIIALDMAGFCVSIGSACSSGAVKSSAVLAAMGIEDSVALSVIRVSSGYVNSKADIAAFIGAWSTMVSR